MKFNIKQSGTKIEIIEALDGDYLDFNAVCADIANRDKTMVIEDIFISKDGITNLIPNGLANILSNLSYSEIIDKLLSDDSLKDYREKQKSVVAEKQKAEALDKQRILETAMETGGWDKVPEAIIKDAAAKIILSTSMFIAKREIAKEIDVLTYECAYGMNIFRDFFNSVRDVVGGRSGTVEKLLRDARITAMQGLREEALKIGADAVIAIDFDYSELSGGGKSGMLVAIASGTAVKLDAPSNSEVK